MLASRTVRLVNHKTGVVQRVARRVQSTQVDKALSDGPIAHDGRHEVWREGIYDHDNEPK